MSRTKLLLPNFTVRPGRDGYYHIRYEENGETKTRSTGTKDPKEAEEVRARFAADYRAPKLDKRPTVAAVCDAYADYRKPLIASPQTLGYSFNPIKRHLGALYADRITQTVVDDYIETREDEPVVRKGGRWGSEPVGEATISKELRMLRAALRWAANENLIEKAPDYRIELSIGDVRPRWITKEEANLLIDAASDHIALFILIALSTAKRRQAILQLKWSDVNLRVPGHESIDFGEDVRNKKRGSTQIGGNKRLVDDLHRAKKVAMSPNVIEFRGEPVKDIKVAMQATSKRAGIEPAVSAHVLKHTAITWMVLAGMSYERISKFANTSAETIERVYGHHNPAFLQEAQAALAF